MATMTKTVFSVGLLLATLLVGATAWADESVEKEHAELAKALTAAKVSLRAALTASEREGKPISAKFEVEDGKLQLSVYTEKKGTFNEVVVNHRSGKVAETEPITGGEDLTAARAQSEAMARARRSLGAAVGSALKANKGFRAVRVVPMLKDAHPVAEIGLMKGAEWKTISEKLD